jgi:hypothetical protein
MAKKTQADFYKDLDEFKKKRGCCSCLSLAVLFIIVLFLVEGTLFYLGRNLKAKPIIGTATKINQPAEVSFSKVDLNNQEFQVVISEGVLCSRMVKFKGLQNGLSCSINYDGIKIEGKLSALSFSNSAVVLRPKVVDNKLEFEVVEAMIGKVRVPRFLVSQAGNIVLQILKQDIPDLEYAKIKSVELQEGIVVISAERK